MRRALGLVVALATGPATAGEPPRAPVDGGARVDGAASSERRLDLRDEELYLVRLDGKPTRLRPFVGDKLTLVNLWATWCPPCRDEMPLLDEIARRYRARGVAVVGLSVDHGTAEVTRYLAEHKVSYPIVVGTEQTVPALGELEMLPTTIVLDRDGAVAQVLVGALTEQDVVPVIEEALRPPSTTPAPPPPQKPSPSPTKPPPSPPRPSR